MLVLLLFATWSFLSCAFYNSVKLRWNENEIIQLNGSNKLATFPSSLNKNKYKRHFFINNSVFEKKNGNKIQPHMPTKFNKEKNNIFLNAENNINPKELIIEKFKSNDNNNDFFYSKFFINNKERTFIIDLCSDNSFIFQKDEKEGIFDMKENIDNTLSNNYINPKLLYMNFHSSDVQEIKDEIYLNNTKLEATKIITTISDHIKKKFDFYVIKNNDISKSFDGIIGFDILKQFNMVIFDTINMKINLIDDENCNELRDNIHKEKENMYAISLRNYSNNLKYFIANINESEPHKCFIDTGNSRTIIVNSDIFPDKYNDAKSVETVENILNKKFSVEKVDIKNFNIITKNNKIVNAELNNVYKGNMEYLDKNVILLGLDFLKDKKLIFDLKNGILYLEGKSMHISSKESTSIDISENSQNLDDVEISRKCKEIYEQLRKKEINFLKITNELESENIYIKDCKNTDDVIKKYAIKLVYGPSVLKTNDRETIKKEFDIRYNEITEFFKKLNNEQKQNMLNDIVNIMKRNTNSNFIGYEHLGEEKVSKLIEQFVNYEINNNSYSLHLFKSNNVNKKNENALIEEYNFLYNVYTSHPEYSFEILNDFKKELTKQKINFKDCKDETDLIKKVAEMRVFLNGKNGGHDNKNKNRRNVIVRKFTNDDNNVHTQIIIRRSGLDSDNYDDNNNLDNFFNGNKEDGEGYSYNGMNNNLNDLFPNSLFSGIFKNFFGNNNNDSEEIDNENDDNQHDLLSELNNFFGLGANMDNNFLKKKKKKKSVIGFKTNTPQNNNNKEEKTDSIEQAIKNEKDVDIIFLLNKVQKLNDDNLKNFILQSLKNDTIRNMLIDAVKNGYQNIYDKCKKQNDNKSMYLLQMLKQSGIF
ncbi:conserved Plasmodium protein, unknown function [Plasmodium berghei]|uniref:Aspartyl protease n=2 Tax=Plasmodium berghei TaxID=5821 RepID=A0A509AFR2_PLABA|nr:conserved protein, unknown function [Plasmodium berghei ANKA]CXI09222.1 conserved Plasmodium protein, unknown function [Plasmodium berghei]SCL92831.1 conserved Plasmodium protein, unknown function [Plasmodium berghei]SCM15730.1 conserved Plasmodium protein, unknown function [Plasmodium berghei]SCM17525.1 conserved Plasmodium protein, unknown function [Plasmodium berghei]SCN22937.1 conserved Plasmodium protein, unknown function [Plasmodium berghei]|eukprot:XP_034420336.1 conserved protein, unknown function [Plasmodium berghei ANKA]